MHIIAKVKLLQRELKIYNAIKGSPFVLEIGDMVMNPKNSSDVGYVKKRLILCEKRVCVGGGMTEIIFAD